MSGAVGFVCGLLFAVGLCFSGMTQPTKVIGFLDFTGDWDPSLAFVMMGAMGVFAIAARWAQSLRAPLMAASFPSLAKRDIDARLVVGAALFGVGWGLAGYCPGPAVASIATLAVPTLSFIGSMLVGMFAFALFERIQKPSTSSPPQATRAA
jgi:uncharacterized membrane protein YedE/YeeE